MSPPVVLSKQHARCSADLRLLAARSATEAREEGTGVEGSSACRQSVAAVANKHSASIVRALLALQVYGVNNAGRSRIDRRADRWGAPVQVPLTYLSSKGVGSSRHQPTAAPAVSAAAAAVAAPTVAEPATAPSPSPPPRCRPARRRPRPARRRRRPRRDEEPRVAHVHVLYISKPRSDPVCRRVQAAVPPHIKLAHAL